MARPKRQIQDEYGEDEKGAFSWRFDRALRAEDAETTSPCSECFGVGEIYLETRFGVLTIPCIACNR